MPTALAADASPGTSDDGPMGLVPPGVVDGAGGSQGADEDQEASKDRDQAEEGPDAPPSAEDAAGALLEGEGGDEPGDPEGPPTPPDDPDDDQGPEADTDATDDAVEATTRFIEDVFRIPFLPFDDFEPHRCPAPPLSADARVCNPDHGATDDTAPDTQSDAATNAEAPMPWLPAGAAVGLGALALIALYRLATTLAGVRAVPLGFRLSRRDLDGHPVRKAMLEYLQLHPGASTQDLACHAEVSYSRATYHLGLLQREDAVRLRRLDGVKRWFAAGAPRIDDQDLALQRLANPRRAAGRMMAYLRSMPGASVSQTARALGLSPSNVHYHVKRLDKEGLVRRVSQGRAVRHYLTAQGHALVDRVAAPSAIAPNPDSEGVPA